MKYLAFFDIFPLTESDVSSRHILQTLCAVSLLLIIIIIITVIEAVGRVNVNAAEIFMPVVWTQPFFKHDNSQYLRNDYKMTNKPEEFSVHNKIHRPADIKGDSVKNTAGDS